MAQRDQAVLEVLVGQGVKVVQEDQMGQEVLVCLVDLEDHMVLEEKRDLADRKVLVDRVAKHLLEVLGSQVVH